ncbi:hypothetical protein DKX38_011177 [Salix brachista]|uniref:RPW8 domain-containing protein n=1 Tax=Salix brachista TaxID=2182728 RepID=A0A5N5M0C1_9ROSI|nr:hypothetical protein DKX38_011177 [Salix brachista]
MGGQVVVSALAGAGFEILFGELLKMGLKVQKNNSQFKSSLERLQKMLEEMAPNIKRIGSFNRELEQPKQLERLQGLLSDGKDLVLKCSKIHKYNCLKRPLYNKKLLKLEKSIRDHINIVSQFQEVADTKEILVKQNSTLVGLNNVSSGVKQLSNQVSSGVAQSRVDSSNSNIRLAGVCSPPLLKVDPVGFEIPLSELSIKLLKDETSQHIVLSALGGCGKTTLATALSQHESSFDYLLLSFYSSAYFWSGYLYSFFMTIMPEIIARDTKELQLEGRDLKGSGSNGTIDGGIVSCAIPESMVMPIGLQVEIGELKMELFKDGVSIAVLSDPPGCGKTTLARLLCHGEEVQEKFKDNIFYATVSINTNMEGIIVNGCKGFPMALKVVILKECFIDLCSFQEDQRILVNALVDMWMELYNLDEEAYVVAKL